MLMLLSTPGGRNQIKDNFLLFNSWRKLYLYDKVSLFELFYLILVEFNILYRSDGAGG